MKGIVLILIATLGTLADGRCQFPRQMRGNIVTVQQYMAAGPSSDNSQISVESFAIDVVNRRYSVKTRDENGYSQFFEFYNQKKTYHVDPHGVCHSYPINGDFYNMAVPQDAHVLVRGRVGQQGSGLKMDVYGGKIVQNIGNDQLKEYYVMQVTNKDCIPMSTTTYTDGRWYKVMHVSHLYDVSLRVNPADFKLPPSCRFIKTSNGKRKRDEIGIWGNLGRLREYRRSSDADRRKPPFRIMGDTGGNKSPPIRVMGDDASNKSPPIRILGDDKSPPIRIMGDHKPPPFRVMGDEKSPPITIMGDDKSLPIRIMGDNKSPPIRIMGGDKSPPFRVMGDEKSPPFKVMGDGKSRPISIMGDDKSPPFRVMGDDKSPPFRVMGDDKPPFRIMGDDKPPFRVTGDNKPPFRVMGDDKSPPFKVEGDDKPPFRVMGDEKPPFRVMGDDKSPPFRVMGDDKPPFRVMGDDKPPFRVMGDDKPPFRVIGDESWKKSPPIRIYG